MAINNDSDIDDHVMDPQENPTGTEHLPVAGEVGNGPVSDRSDPTTYDTDDTVGTSDGEVSPLDGGQ